jgi:hypothetical protein
VTTATQPWCDWHVLRRARGDVRVLVVVLTGAGWARYRSDLRCANRMLAETVAGAARNQCVGVEVWSPDEEFLLERWARV